MSILAPERPGDEVQERLAEAESPALLAPDPAPAPPLTLAFGVLLSTAAAAWTVAGLFSGFGPRAVGLAGSALGVGIVAASHRARRQALVQYLALPAAVIAGAAIALPGSRTGLPSNVAAALAEGGISQPPLNFDPGWRFLLMVFTALLGAAALSLATAMDRPRLGVLLPLPVTFAAALIQPAGATLLSGVAALVLLLGALAVSYGVELSREGATTGEFEFRRLARGGVVLAGLVLGLTALSRIGALFPDPADRVTIPPQRPQVRPLQSDRVLFTVDAERPGPWRLGVLDVYDGRRWLTPPFDSGRLREVPDHGAVPVDEPLMASTAPPQQARFRMGALDGRLLPALANPTRLRHDGAGIEYDPRTQALRLNGGVPSGLSYTVEAPAPAGGAELSEAAAPPVSLRPFLRAPLAPNEVVTLLAEAPANHWDRLQFVRNAFYQQVVAAGAGNPVDVPPARVVELLRGDEGSPFEITAAEVLLARWAGVPARMGYGYSAGDKTEGGFEVHPRHGSTWLEAYFHGHGWVPVVGLPPRAKPSFSQGQKQGSAEVRPTEELALVLYVPVKLQTIQLLYQDLRAWLATAFPVVAGALAAWALFPGALKALRRLRRRRWAAGQGARGRIAVAYAELRDMSADLGIGQPASTPMEFVGAFEPDEEHEDLAWLVTRALWGDLGRDLRDEDVLAAEEMARSVGRRIRRAQPAVARVVGVGARTSLREPYTDEVPNLWPRRRRRWWALPAAGAAVVVGLVGSAAAAGDASPAPSGPTASLDGLVPADLGGLRVERELRVEQAFARVGEQSLLAEGRVFTLRREGQVEGYLQLGAFEPEVRATQPHVRDGVLRNIATGKFERTRIGGERIYTKRAGEQTFFLWFPADGAAFQLLVARQELADPAELFAEVLAASRGEPLVAGDLRRPPLRDPRRGGEE